MEDALALTLLWVVTRNSLLQLNCSKSVFISEIQKAILKAFNSHRRNCIFQIQLIFKAQS